MSIYIIWDENLQRHGEIMSLGIIHNHNKFTT